jgi:hypothetical protein
MASVEQATLDHGLFKAKTQGCGTPIHSGQGVVYFAALTQPVIPIL